MNANSWQVYANDILVENDIVISLTPSESYKFKVRSRNVIGYSDYSNEVTIMAA